MGGVSTSHSAVLRSGKAQSSSGFDLHSWQGLTEVLRVGKESLRDPNAYAEFRNLVLQYAQQGGDAELKRQIDAVTATFKKINTESAPSPKIEEKQSAPVQHVETKIPVKREQSIPVPEKAIPEKTIEERKAPVMGMRRGAPLFTPATVTTHVVSANLVPPAPKEVPQTKPTFISEQIVVSEEPKKEETPRVVVEPVSVPPVSVAEAPAPAKFKTLEEHRARISEIKRLVNAHVGNPVALIDTKNDHGRTYMNALLSALKATGGNGTEGVDSAMVKLEEAYATLVDDSAQEENKVEITPVPKAPEVSTQKEDAPKEPVLASEKVVEPVASPAPEPVPAVEKKVSVVQSTQSPDTSSTVKKYSVADTLARLTKVQTEKTVPVSSSVQPVTPKASPVKDSQASDTNTLEHNKYTLKEVAKVHHEEILKRDVGINPSEIVVKQTELSTPQITEALNQLLHEWSLFSGSGLFGIGPGGSEHPLYLKLAPLSMGEVVAGRWEGSNPKTLKVIKQYVDAWRHEQGVAYTINETFEHYLRRVVQRILKRQNP